MTFRDGCTSIGGDCTCPVAPGTPDECVVGSCFQGLKYNDSSVYCQCELNVLDDNEVYHLKKGPNRQEPLQTDAACSVRPAFGYYGEGFADLINVLKRQADEKQLGSWHVAWMGRNLSLAEWSKVSTNSPQQAAATLAQLQRMDSPDQYKKALDQMLAEAKENLARINSAAKDPKETRSIEATFVDIFDSSGKPGQYNEKAYGWFKNRFFTLIGARSIATPGNSFVFDFSSDCDRAIRKATHYITQRANGDPCTCQYGTPGKSIFEEKRTFKPGICRVNRCISPGILRCHCAE